MTLGVIKVVFEVNLVHSFSNRRRSSLSELNQPKELQASLKKGTRSSVQRVCPGFTKENCKTHLNRGVVDDVTCKRFNYLIT